MSFKLRHFCYFSMTTTCCGYSLSRWLWKNNNIEILIWSTLYVYAERKKNVAGHVWAIVSIPQDFLVYGKCPKISYVSLVQWATCAAWHWGPHSEGEKTSMVWTCGMLQWCNQDSLWHTGWWKAWAWEAQNDMEVADREGLQRVEALGYQPSW